MIETLMGIMDVVYENSVSAIQGLQGRFLQQSDVFFMISNVFDPRYAFLVYSPLFVSLDAKLGKKIMWVTVIAEWVNQMLKWALHGERPYWWVHETQVYNRTGLNVPELQQFHMTCETGPGSPSGHAMVTAAVWYVILDYYLQKFNLIQKDGKNIFPKLCWMAYIVLLTTVSASRIFIAAHFPHQCFLGIAVGCVVALWLDNIAGRQMSRGLYVAMTAGMLASGLAMYSLLQAVGVDPLWSVSRALKWCARREYVHLDTSPFFSMVRYLGFMFGMGFGFNSAAFSAAATFALPTRIVCAVLSVAMCKFSEKISFLGTSGTLPFYVQAFLLNAVLAYGMIALVPGLVSSVSGAGKKKLK